ncbi:ervatamin-B-like [Vicia villosa]|uniref:ervatamin-B-like n=1 Tax=Vicia villosa TaxID=3911 RepID=UPI00273C3F66|nr:ervatamin-B-like [Vicia villosa]
MISQTSNLVLFFIIFTTSSCISSSTYDVPTIKYSSILGPNHDKLPTQNETRKLFQSWMKEHGRVYKNVDEMAKKFNIFKSNLKYITKTNAKRKSPHGHVLGLTNFADWSHKEFKKTYLHKNDMSMHNNTMKMKMKNVTTVSCSAPKSLDWRSKGVVGSVKEQRTCGSCWTFSAAGAIESINAIVTGKLVDLSEQEMLDCEPSGDCKFGYMSKVFDWVLLNKGVALEKDYVYTGTKGVCNSQISNSESSTFDTYDLVEQSDNGLLCAVVNQPISVCLYAPPDFYHYSHGIYDGPNCPENSDETNHCLLIVGYDSVDGQDYWILKNSWSTHWGMEGYMYLKRNTNKQYGVCAINAWGFNLIKHN